MVIVKHLKTLPIMSLDRTTFKWIFPPEIYKYLIKEHHIGSSQSLNMDIYHLVVFDGHHRKHS